MAECKESGKNLIFMISQPRAGSTLVQRTLGSHPDIHTMPETWTMLNSLYALKNEGYEAEYNSEWARLAVRDFLHRLPNGESSYYEGVAKMHSYLYQLALEQSGKKIFLDKTPRYFHIIPELHKTFPEATFIILFRNPLAVLCSMITTWIKGNEHWSHLSKYQADLLLAPSLLIEATKLIPSSQLIKVRYEDFISQPEKNIREICGALQIKYFPNLANYDSSERQGFGYSEQKKPVGNFGMPDAGNLSRWINELEDPQTWRLVRDYLDMLGETVISEMSYSYTEFSEIVYTRKPTKKQLREAVPLQWLFKKPKGFLVGHYYLIRLHRSIRRMKMESIWLKMRLSIGIKTT